MNIAVMLSGGIGSRVGGDIPKQYLKLKNKRLIYYSLESLINSNYIDKICIVASEEWSQILQKEIDDKEKIIGYARPGETRQLSIVNAMNYVKTVVPEIKDSDLIFIHDAARPFLTENMIETYIEAIEGHDGVIPVLPMKDTVYVSEDGNRISQLIDRKTIFAGQAPEVFVFNGYYEANMKLFPSEIMTINGSTEPAVMAQMDVVMVKGEEKNIKVTVIEDLEKIMI